MMWGYYNNWFMGGFGWIFMILFWGLVIWAIIAFTRGTSGCCGGSHHPEEKNHALEILKERFAKGEINKKEFEEKKKDLIT